MDWLAEFGIEARELDRPAALGVPATLTIIRRHLRTDARSYLVLPIDRAVAGDERRDAIVRRMREYFPEVRPRGYDREQHVATFTGRKHVYVAVYEEHDVGTKSVSDAA